MGVIAAYRRVFSNGHLGRLMIGEFVSSIGDWLYLVALLIVVYAETADPTVLGIVGAARVLPYVFLSVPAGVLADRIDRRTILLATDLIRGAIMLAMAAVVVLDGPVVAIIALAILATCFSAFFSPAIGSYIPSLVRDESELGPANSTWSTLDNLAFIIGPAVAGLLIGAGGLVLAFVLNAASFGFVAAVLWGLPPSRAAEGAGAMTAGDQPEEATAPAASGVRALLRPVAAPLLGIALIETVGAFVMGGLGVLTVVIAVDVLGAGEAGTGLLNAAVGVGGMLGGLASTALVLRRRLAPPVLGGGLVLAASVALLGQSGTLAIAMAAMAVGSAGGLLIEVVSTTLVQRVVPDQVRGRAIGTLETLSIAAYAAGSFALPVLAVPIGMGPVLGAMGLVIALSVVAGVPLLGRHAMQGLPKDATRAHLLRVPILAGLGAARLEVAMEDAQVVPMVAGQVIVRQGDAADRFYVIAEGTVEVTQRDPRTGVERVLRRMGPDDVFGEIGLLTDGVRTATVTALEPGMLLALDRPAFLELVGSGPGLTSRLLDLHRGSTSLVGSGG